ncbi:outer membrane beta-barrel protein [Muribaculum intestinale]|uniref:outer membrane beta-barrel protein n=1 Tax=Muribaculum intestinale TaxID=1796646 RepID=UPI0025B5E7CF|nr:outer membrane beta-barrel protein [Muribaculum intestinale]
MKHILLFAITALSVLAANAQDIDEDVLPSDRDHWTVTVTYDASIPGKWKLANGSFKMFKPGSGISVGADYMWLFGKNFFFEPGVRFFIDNYRYDNITIGAGTPSEPSKTYDPPVRKTGLRIPLSAGYKFDIFKRGSLFLSTGPEPIIGFSARTKVDEDQTEIFEKNMYKTLMRRFDVAWDIRAAVIIDRFRVDITGAFGMLDIIKTDVKMHEYRVSVGLGYVF